MLSQNQGTHLGGGGARLQHGWDLLPHGLRGPPGVTGLPRAAPERPDDLLGTPLGSLKDPQEPLRALP